MIASHQLGMTRALKNKIHVPPYIYMNHYISIQGELTQRIKSRYVGQIYLPCERVCARVCARVHAYVCCIERKGAVKSKLDFTSTIPAQRSVAAEKADCKFQMQLI